MSRRVARKPAQPVPPAPPQREHFTPSWVHDRAHYVTHVSHHAHTWVERVLDGAFRIPRFQRPWRWTDAQIVYLLDSLMQGYGTGTMLLWERYGLPATVQRFGEVDVACKDGKGVMVVDGQQRLSALVTACKADRFWFDLLRGQFLVTDTEGPWLIRVDKLLQGYGSAGLDWFRGHADRFWLPPKQVFDAFCASVAVALHAQMNATVVPSDWGIGQGLETFRRINTAGTPVSETDLRASLEAGEA